MRIGVGGKVLGTRVGVSNRGVGVGVGPFKATTGWGGRRGGGGGCATLIGAVLAVGLFIIAAAYAWPIAVILGAIALAKRSQSRAVGLLVIVLLVIGTPFVVPYYVWLTQKLFLSQDVPSVTGYDTCDNVSDVLKGLQTDANTCSVHNAESALLSAGFKRYRVAGATAAPGTLCWITGTTPHQGARTYKGKTIVLNSTCAPIPKVRVPDVSHDDALESAVADLRDAGFLHIAADGPKACSDPNDDAQPIGTTPPAGAKAYLTDVLVVHRACKPLF